MSRDDILAGVMFGIALGVILTAALHILAGAL
jgi:hypothetical protein